MVPWQRTPQDDRLLAALRAARRDPDPVTMAFLERLQRDTYDGLRRNVEPPDDVGVRRMFPTATNEDVSVLTEFLRDARSGFRAPTRYESPGAHFLLQMLAVRIDEQVAAHGRWTPPKRPPVFGLLRRGEVSALAVRVPGNGDHLVLVDEELFVFLNVFAKAVALALPRTVKAPLDEAAAKAFAEHVRRHLDVHPEAVDRFSDAVLAFTIAGRASAAEHYQLPAQLVNFASALCQASELFVVAHEYAHVLEGHLSRALPNRDGEEDGVVRQSMLSMADEGIADRFGLDLTTRALMAVGADAHFGWWGQELFLYCNEILMKALGILRTGSERGMHEGELHQHATFDGRRTIMDYFHQAPWIHVVRDVVTELWQRTRPLVEAAHRRGVRPSPIWDA